MISAKSGALVWAAFYLAASAAGAQDSALRSVHVFVALADNQSQGIIPVPAKLGNGEDPEHNLYWGSAYGVKTFFARSSDWERIACGEKPKTEVLERCVFKHRATKVYLVADAYRGREIGQAILDFLSSAAGDDPEMMSVPAVSGAVKLPTRGGANLVAYIGHDGLMDFQLQQFPHKKNDRHHDAIVLACASKMFFAEPMRASGAYPLLWTTGRMAPEAYTLKSALDGWIAGESNDQIRDRAAEAYDKYQKCGFRAARRLLTSGW
ncbi:MAG TPA: hypothetical protein VIX37_02705 [Candidatus Sulfotelmatobacter sp.]